VEAVDVGHGSGFLIQHGGRYLVITNRHVVEHARQGIRLHFRPGEQRHFAIPEDKVKVEAIHQSADLAMLDVNQAAEEIKQGGIAPLRIAPVGHKTEAGEDVFAIGHPGGGETIAVLPSTVTKGAVSAVDRSRPSDNARYLQVTVPINPGNSGGPLFDYHGRIVGVNTFGIRQDKGTVLEALNFAMETDFVHELLNDRGKSRPLPPPTESPPALAAELAAKERRLKAAGYRVSHNPRVFRLKARSTQAFQVPCPQAGVYAVITASRGAVDIDLFVLNDQRDTIAADIQVNPDPEVKFEATEAGTYYVVVFNPSPTDALVELRLLMR
jgi:S1-C subfamily serine protease